MAITIKDVAKEAGVSIATVSYVLNNKVDSISESTRQHVLETAKRIGYTPNVTARNLKLSKTQLIGYAWHEIPTDQVNPIMDRFTYQLAHAAEAQGYHVLTFTHPEDDPAPAYDGLIQMGRVDAFVLAAIQQDDPRMKLLHERKIPFASFGRSNASGDAPWVDVDGEDGVRQAVNYLAELGHRRIAMVGWNDDSSVAIHRQNGFIQAMADLELPIHDEYIVLGENTESLGREALRQWIELPKNQRPTAVFASSDLEAIGVMNEAQDRGLVIGEELSVIGFDDVPMSQHLRPALTTLQQPIAEVAHTLIGMIQRRLKSKKVHHQETCALLKPKLIVRESCGAPPSD